MDVYSVDESTDGLKFYSVEKWKGYDLSHIDFNVEGKYRCPACEDDGRDRSGDNLFVFGLDDDGEPLGATCFSEKHFSVPSMKKIMSKDSDDDNRFNGRVNKLSSNSKNNSVRSRVRKLPKDFKSSCLSQERIDEIIASTTDTLTCKYRGLQRYNDVSKKNGIRYELDNDGNVTKMYTPSYYFDGEKRILTGYQIRVVSPRGFFFEGFNSVEVSEFVGKSYSSKVADTLIIVGGAVDYVTVQGAVNDLMMKYKTHKINVVSTVMGESSCAESIRNDYDWVVAHKKIILALDNDDAGWRAIDDALSVLPSEQCFTANFGNFKDPNSYALNTQQLLQDIYWNVVSVDDFGYVGADELFDMGLDVLYQDKIKFPYFLKDLANSFTDGEIGLGEWVNIIASTSAGKSTIIDAWKDEWIDVSPYKQAVNSFEASGGRYGIKEVSSMVGKNIGKISGKQERIDFYESQRSEYMDRVLGDDGKPKYYFVSKVPKSIDQFKKMLLRLVKVENVKVIWIDPALSLKAMCEHDKEFNDLLVWIDQNIRLEHDCLIITVQHTRKNLSSGKNASQGGELAEEDGEGGRMLISLATVNIGVERNKEAVCNIERNTTLISLFKNRNDQMTGRHIAKLFYRVKANRLYPYSDALSKNFFNDDEFTDIVDLDKDVGKSLDHITTDIDDYENVQSNWVEDDVPLPSW